MSKPLNPTPLILDNSLRGQLKMDTKNTPLPLNTTRLILMYKVGQGVRGQTHTHTVCVTYYKASPYNISHTKNIFTAKYNRVIYANTIILKLHMHIKRRQFQ